MIVPKLSLTSCKLACDNTDKNLHVWHVATHTLHTKLEEAASFSNLFRVKLGKPLKIEVR